MCGKRKPIDAATRERLFIIFGGLCVYCDKRLLRGSAQPDHFMPIYAGGCNHEHNLVLSCMTCNEDKANFDPIDYLIKIGRIRNSEFNRAIKALDTCTEMDSNIKKIKERTTKKRRRYSKKDFAVDRWK